MRDVVVVTGYLLRCPLAGYAWQALHYLQGLRDLGFDPLFYEDTAYYGECLDPVRGSVDEVTPAALAFAGGFFAEHGFGDRWVFHDVQRDRFHGRDRAETEALLHAARLLLSLAAVNRLPRGIGRRRVFVDIDPAVTQIEAERSGALRELLDEYDVHFTIGENIGRTPCAVPSGGREWLPTRQPIALGLWTPQPPAPAAPYTTIGRWDERRRVQQLGEQVYSWSKRDQWLRFLELPRRSGAAFELAMDVDTAPGDRAALGAEGWAVVDPIAVSTDAARYRDYIRRSRGEFSVAKELNVHLATGWFSDRSACYLAAGRPVIVQDTGFGAVLPTGAGLFAFNTPDDAVDAVRAVETDWDLHSAAARRIAEQHFAAAWVLSDLLARSGL
ncbi:MAG: glycosyltransferase [Candidatus Binatia bacterium]